MNRRTIRSAAALTAGAALALGAAVATSAPAGAAAYGSSAYKVVGPDFPDPGFGKFTDQGPGHEVLPVRHRHRLPRRPVGVTAQRLHQAGQHDERPTRLGGVEQFPTCGRPTCSRRRRHRAPSGSRCTSPASRPAAATTASASRHRPRRPGRSRLHRPRWSAAVGLLRGHRPERVRHPLRQPLRHLQDRPLRPEPVPDPGDAGRQQPRDGQGRRAADRPQHRPDRHRGRRGPGHGPAAQRHGLAVRLAQWLQGLQATPPRCGRAATCSRCTAAATSGG